MEKMISEQEYIEATNQYRAKIKMLRDEIAMVNVFLSDAIKQANRAKFRYDNIKSLLNRYIATGLMPGYFDIYNDLQDTKHKLKDARKEAAAANKRYKQLKKEFSRYRNEHTDSDCNPTVQKEHQEKAVEFKCEECASSYKDTTSAEVDIMYCESMVDGKCECYCGSVSDVRACPGFKPKEEPNE